MHGGPPLPTDPRLSRPRDDSRLYPFMTVIAGVLFVLFMIGLVIVLRWLGGGEEAIESLGPSWGAR